MAGTLNRYPDRDAVALRADLAAYLGHGLGADQVWAANGSNEIIQQLFQAFGGPGRTALGFEPSYSMHPLIALATGTRWVSGARDADFGLEPDHAMAVIRAHQPDLVFLTSPNNPTGAALAPEVIEAVCAAAPGLVIVDEAYAEFARDTRATALTLLPRCRRLVVTRTMSKAFALAGARVGYLAADPAVPQALLLVRLPYHLSAVTQAVARAALALAHEPLATVAALRAQRDELVAWLRGRGLRVADSDANFVLFGEFSDRHLIWQALLDRGVLIRETGPARLAAGHRGDPRRDVGLPRRSGRGARGGPGGRPPDRRCAPSGGQPRLNLGGVTMNDTWNQAVRRTGRVERVTKETSVLVELDLDGSGTADVSTGVPFFDHMLSQLAKHGLLDLSVRTTGDIEVDAHHTVEDTALALGQALREALGDKSGICRFGDAAVPLDETLARAAIDLSGRPYLVHAEPDGMAPLIGSYDTTLTRHFFESVTSTAGICLHLEVTGRNPHHLVEAQFKAVARALRAAAARDPRAAGIPSTKGVL